MNAVGNFSRDSAHVWTYRGNIDLDVRVRVRWWGPRSWQIIQTVVFTLILKPLVTSKRPDTRLERFNVIFHPSCRFIERHTITTHDMPPHLASKPKTKTSLGITSKFPRDLR